MVRDEIEFYGPVELRELEEPFDAVCRGIIEGADRDELILDLRKREFTPEQADRFIARAEDTLARLGGPEEEYAAVQRQQTVRLLIGVAVLIGGLAFLLAFLPFGWLAWGPLGVGAGLICAAAALKIRYADLRRRLETFRVDGRTSGFEPVYRKLAPEADDAEVRVGSVTFTALGIYRLTRGLKDKLIPREAIRRVELLTGARSRHPVAVFAAGALLIGGGIGAGIFTYQSLEQDGVIPGWSLATAVIATILGLPLLVAAARRAPCLEVTTDSRIHRLKVGEIENFPEISEAAKVVEQKLGYTIEQG